MKVSSIDGRSSFLIPGKQDITHATASFLGGWVCIKQKGAASYFDSLKDAAAEGGEAVKAGDFIKLDGWDGSSPLSEGDMAAPYEEQMLCWVTDSPSAPSQGTVDFTTQCDVANGEKDIREDGQVSETGTQNGAFKTDSEFQRQLEALFATRIVSKAGKITRIAKTKNRWVHLFVYRKMTDSGEIQVSKIRRMMISGIDEGQPSMTGAGAMVPFNFSYTVLKSWVYEEHIG